MKVFTERSLWLIFLAASFTLILTLAFPVIDEESVYILQAIEMLHHHEYFTPILLGTTYRRTPLLDWMIMGGLPWFGWDSFSLLARAITAFATLGMAAVLASLTQFLWKDRTRTALTTAIFLSGDILLKRGWLAYADPLFSFFVFGAIAAQWIAVEKEKNLGLFVAAAALNGAFLSKALTAYIFYGIAGLVFLLRHRHGRFLLRPTSLGLQLLSLAAPLWWFTFIRTDSHGSDMLVDIVSVYQTMHLEQYFYHLWDVFQEIFVRSLPFSLLIFFVKQPKLSASAKTAAWIAFFNTLPYWLAPAPFFIRYLMPITPLAAIFFADILLQARPFLQRITTLALVLFILIKVFYVAYIPHFEKTHRGDYARVARQIYALTGRHAVFLGEGFARELALASQLDLLRLPWPPVRICGSLSDQEGFVLSELRTHLGGSASQRLP